MRTKSAIVFACGLAMLTVVQGQVQQQPPPPTQTGAPPAGRQGPWRRRRWPRRGADPVRQLHRIRQDLRRDDADQLGRRSRRSGGSRAAAIVGETTPEKPLSENTFLIYRGSEPDNFELKLEFRMNSTNSGVQYRSRQLTGAVGKWVLCGYQADIDFANAYTGMLYEERGRPGFLAPRGTVQYAGPNDVKQGQCSSGQPVAPRGQGAGRRRSDAAPPAAAPTPPAGGTASAAAAARPDWTSGGRRSAARHHQDQ